MEDNARAKWIAFGAVLVAAGIAAFVYLALLPEPVEPPPAPPAPPPAPAVEPPAAPQPAEQPPAPAPAPAEPQPDDVRIRELAKPLSTDPELARWLEAEHMLERFTALVESVANGASPRKLLPFLAPVGRFAVFERDGKEYIDPAGYRRYDRLVQAFCSLDSAGSAEVLKRLSPWLERSYRDLGRPDRSFRKALAEAMGVLLAVPVVEGDVLLERIEVNLKFADPALEGMSEAQKHLFRTGPENMRRVQMKLREIARAMRLSLPAAGEP
ncbi:MAG: DUF3014 domain-containing protein [Deltaproteobacteria bacterium]|nr:DUF3014 domain-containing protein [Deltaproteobacteria bacterium]